MRRRLAAASVAGAVLASAPAAAHDFWLEPEAFRLQVGQAVAVTAFAGHGTERRPSPLPRRRVVRFEATGPDGGPVGGLGPLQAGPTGLSAPFAAQAPGVHAIVLATDLGGTSQLSAARFNAHVAEEGLTPAAEARAARGQGQEPASERYGRYAVALVQAGAGAARPWAMAPTGGRLELIVAANPYARPDGRTLPVQVRYEGRPLAGARVRLTPLDGDGQAVAVRTSDAHGRVAVPWPQAGRWRLTTAWTKPLPPGEPADFETVFASLSFGVGPP